MNFRSILPPHPANAQLTHHDKTFWLGSCFTEAIGQRMQERKFPALVNPFGNIFNPLSLVLHLERMAKDSPATEEELLEAGEQWFSWQHHSSISASNADALKALTAKSWQESGQWLGEAKMLFITLGSSWVYEHRNTQQLVANCHKQAGQEFRKYLLKPAEIVAAFKHALSYWQERNPALKIILTVSPVKHLRDGIAENNRSKAVLLLAAHELAEASEMISYFPAYELVSDDLRDYRFYREDLAHPNALAEKYVWEYFCEGFFSKETQKLIAETESLLSGIRHRPLHPQGKAHRKFLQQLHDKALHLGSLGINTEAEITSIQKQIL